MPRRIASQDSVHNNGNTPPPSTLAAQIVQNQVRPAVKQQNGETATFAQLLHEILHNHAATPETDVTVNVKLISVVAEAGLAPLTESSPFARWEVLISQAVDSIAVIEATIKRQPEALLSLIRPEGPPLILPLLTRLLAVCGKPYCEDVFVLRLLNSIFRALSSSIDLWQHAITLQHVIQDCAYDIISTLETSARSTSDFNIKLPPAKSVPKFWPQSENSIALPFGCQTSVSNQSQAFMLALELSNFDGLDPHWRNKTQAMLQRIASQFQSRLEDAKQWETALQNLLASPHCLNLLIHILDKNLQTTVASSVQPFAAKALVYFLRCDPTVVRDHLVPGLLRLTSTVDVNELHEDLKIAVAATLFRFCDVTYLPEQISSLCTALRQGDVMTDSRLHCSFQQLCVAPSVTCSQLRRRKRRKISLDDCETRRSEIVQRTAGLLGGNGDGDLTVLADNAPNVYMALNDEQKCAAWQSLTDVAPLEPSTTLQTVSRLLEIPELTKSKELRVLSMLAIRSCVEQTNDATFLDLATSSLGRLCLQSLHSSLRELRVAAGRCIPYFLRPNLSTELLERNRKTAIKYLRTLSDQDTPGVQETLIGVWVEVALISGEKEMNLTLLRLVEYLGHRNPLICGLASTELEKLAAAKNQTIAELFLPFWSSIAVGVVQDLHSRPQKVQQLCDLLSININQFLVMTQRETIPRLVLTKRRDILQRIAFARGKETTIQDLCFQPRANLASIVALLLVQAGSDPEKATTACLTEVDSSFHSIDLVSLVKLDPGLIGSNILILIGNHDEPNKLRTYQAFQMFSAFAEGKQGQSKPFSKGSRTITEYFETYILGILTYFSQVIEGVQTPYPITEKVSCLKAIEVMIVLIEHQVSIALPQFRATLQSAMEQPALCEYAFSAWLKLLSVLSSDEVALILDQSFALILQYWCALSPQLQELTHESIGKLVKDHSQAIKDNIMTIPDLSKIPLLSKYAVEIERFRSQERIENHYKAFSKRLRDESRIVVLRALEELVPFLDKHQEFIHDSAVSEQPALILTDIVRALLDTTAKYSTESEEVADLCGQALGIVGCLDPNRVESTRKSRRIVVVSNFDSASEVVHWAIVLLEDVLVEAFKSVNNARSQGFLAYVMQELLRFCGVNETIGLRPRASQAPSVHQRWMGMPEHVRITLTPLLNSKYVITNTVAGPPSRLYPGFSVDGGHSAWLQSLVYDLLWKAKGENAQMLFPLLARVIRGHDLAIASFILPYAILNVVVGGTVMEVKNISDELLAVLNHQPMNNIELDTVKLCSEEVFAALDYMTTWLQEKKKALSDVKAASRTGESSNNFDEAKDKAQIETVEKFLADIPAEIIAARAMLCGSFARALFHWEHFIRQQRPLIPTNEPFKRLSPDELLYDKLQAIYSEIDEPDGLEGIVAHLPFLNEDQQAMQHVKAGRWSAAQAWYELKLAAKPHDIELEERLLGCLRETGRYAPLLRYTDAFFEHCPSVAEEHLVLRKARLIPLALEAHWMTGDLNGLVTRLKRTLPNVRNDFNTGVAEILTTIINNDDDSFAKSITRLRRHITQSMTKARTSSIQASHHDLRNLHVLYEIVAISKKNITETKEVSQLLDKRLAAIGSYVSDKQYVLGVRRAVMQARWGTFGKDHIGMTWLTTAKLARQVGNTESAYNAVLKALNCGDTGAKLEEARLLWRDGHQRHAIQALESAIDSSVFETTDVDNDSSDDSHSNHKQNMLSAKANLLLAKWLDASGQSQASDITERYQHAARQFQRWEKGHYYLGKHYQKLLEAERALPVEKQSARYLSGEITKAVIENQTRSIPFGNKYWHQTIPKILTLWLDLGMDALSNNQNPKEDRSISDKRARTLQACNRHMQKYFDRVPSYVYYSALPQMLSRIAHPNADVWKPLCTILTKIVSTYPNQSLWSLLALTKSTNRLRVERGIEILDRLRDLKARAKTDPGIELRIMIAQGQKLSDGLLQACEKQIDSRKTTVSLSSDLNFNHKLAPNPLVVPIELTLTVNCPSGANRDTINKHKAFVQDRITIQSFDDHVLVLSSLQRPRKITVRGSDGKQYGLLCKPKDDLRKDQRLMEFNGIINRALKRDAECSKRRLYIKTYAVTPLSEESGTIEWVEGIKPLRDILLNIYTRRGIKPQYAELKAILTEACAGPEKAHIFSDKVLSRFPAVLHEWFTESYSEPNTWLAARLRYARTAAVMSVTGHVLGLGDRHGENILLEQGTGGIFHVDFNCLFDKGLSFEKPELVPFRLTHNMVDAMGPYGYEGPFRTSSELTLRLLRQSKDTLMTVLETFLYDPTTDFVGQKKKSIPGVPETPQQVLDSVDRKLKGLLRGENVPLGVEGYVDALIREAVSHFNLASMYIGWCPFL